MTDPWDWYVYLHVPSCTYMKTIKKSSIHAAESSHKKPWIRHGQSLPLKDGVGDTRCERRLLAATGCHGMIQFTRWVALNPKLKKTCQKRGIFPQTGLKQNNIFWNHDHKLNERHRILVKYGDDDFIILNTSIKNQQYVTHFFGIPFTSICKVLWSRINIA